MDIFANNTKIKLPQIKKVWMKISQSNEITRCLEIEQENLKILSLSSDIDKKRERRG